MKKNKQLPNNQITIYQSPDGGVNIEVLYANENVWLTQKKMAELFDVDRTVITKHLANIFKECELDEHSVSANFAHTAEDGKTYRTKFYSLEAIRENYGERRGDCKKLSGERRVATSQPDCFSLS